VVRQDRSIRSGGRVGPTVTAIDRPANGRRARLAAIAAGVMAACVLAVPGQAAAEPTVWLCKPGLADNPCTPGLDTTRISPSGDVLGVERIEPDRPLTVDCFYVYPTVSDDSGLNSDLIAGPEERSIALYQAARYSQHCRVFAPMYRQITIASLLTGAPPTPEQGALAYGDVADAWQEYLARYNHGRGVILIGHSQGTFLLRRLVADLIDDDPAARKRLVSAILLGGNVIVQEAKTFGGDFQHVRGCKSAKDVGCVVAFSTFDEPVPPDARFGRLGGDFVEADPARFDILCTNPAALRGGPASLEPVLPSEPFAPTTTIGVATTLIGWPPPSASISTPWYGVPGAYRGRCSSAGEADVLQISPLGGAPDLRAIPDPDWGLHLVDANIALGNLVSLVASQAGTYLKRDHSSGKSSSGALLVSQARRRAQG
jgi:Protein of unknown function (DUF3089)